ncbi:hypothetical protein CC77DRAFT_12993 [Alternaria alternata]|uniref:Uncharacterized protein n=1 Tax=Alternaria alternata TaxID=5599 RepID=A0A177E3C4_ALTAL|nr:hypothetical protein CC77DRAFT_12993 [Alternaria alternata]OAG25910.1 hypothetical protein CC77DRAFT_12993 [Alternaria alternata]
MRRNQVYIIEVCEKVLPACSLAPTLCACSCVSSNSQSPNRKKEKGKASRVCYKGKCSSFADRSE